MGKEAIEDRRVEVQRRLYSIRLSAVFEKSRLRARRNGTRETARWNSEGAGNRETKWRQDTVEKGGGCGVGGGGHPF